MSIGHLEVTEEMAVLFYEGISLEEVLKTRIWESFED